MYSTLSNIQSFVKEHFNDIIMFVIVILLIMLAFSAGYITAKYQSKTPLIIEESN